MLLKKCSLYLIRLSSDNTTKWGKPCSMCSQLNKKYKIKKVVIYYEKESLQQKEYEKCC